MIWFVVRHPIVQVGRTKRQNKCNGDNPNYALEIKAVLPVSRGDSVVQSSTVFQSIKVKFETNAHNKLIDNKNEINHYRIDGDVNCK